MSSCSDLKLSYNNLQTLTDELKLKLQEFKAGQGNLEEAREIQIRVEAADWEYEKRLTIQEQIVYQLDFFGRLMQEVPPLPKEITPERLKFWESIGYKLKFLPKVAMKEDETFPGWKYKPGRRNNLKRRGMEFYDELTSIEYQPDNQANPNLQGLSPIDLPGRWVLYDARPKPDYEEGGNQPYQNDSLMQKALQRLVQDSSDPNTPSTLNSEAVRCLRNAIHPDVFKKDMFWKAMAEMLGIDKIPEVVVRLPRVIEANVMGQGRGYHDSNALEWNEECYLTRGRVMSGDSKAGGASALFWGDTISSYNGFRPLVIFPE